MLVEVGDRFQVGATHQLFFFAVVSVLEENNIDVVKGSELLLDGPDELFVPDADVLSMFKVHGRTLGFGEAIYYPKKGLNKGQNSNRIGRTMVPAGRGRG